MIGTALSLLAGLLGPTPNGLVDANRCAAVIARDGRVVDAAFYRQMVGFAAAAGTRGGLGRRQYLVRRTADDTQPGSLRHAVRSATGAGGGWISFAPELRGQTVRVQATLRPGSNITVDGGCAEPRLIGVGRGSLFNLHGVSNVVLARMQMTQAGGPIDGDCVTVSHGADRIWIANNRISSCKDGLVDVTRPEGGRMRVTMSGNLFSDHDKAILVDGGPGSRCNGPPAIHLTLFRNDFRRTGQRHPRVSGNAFVHAAQNRMRFSPRQRGSGTVGGAAGIVASNGARVLGEDLLFEPQGSKRLRLSEALPDASGLPACRQTAIRLVRASGPEPARSFRPELVGGVPYTLPRAPAPAQLRRLLDLGAGPEDR
jgi:pectate lyase